MLAWILLLLSLSGAAYYTLAIWASLRFFSRRGETPAPGGAPPPHLSVSIIKPISGGAEETFENLASFCGQAYDDYEIVFGVQAGAEASIATVERLQSAFPTLPITYVIAHRPIGLNPKVNNLAAAYDRARNELLVISDSDVRVTPTYLSEIAKSFADPATGAATCLYRSQASGVVSTFESLGIATEFMPTLILANYLEGITFGLGSTIAMRRTVLDQIGGFAAIANCLHDDFQLGRLAHEAGHKVVLSPYIVDHVSGRMSLTDMFRRQARWARGTRIGRPLGYYGLAFTYGTIWSAAFALASNMSAYGSLALAGVWGIRWLMAWLIGVHFLNDQSARRALLLVPLRDLASFLFWIYGFFGNTIIWRGRRMRLRSDGKLQPVNS